MKFVCHIGHHKTGTTSLQVFLSQNAIALLKAGILYPSVESQGAALMLARALGGDSADVLPINMREAHNALAFRMLADTLPNWKVPQYHRELPHSNQMLISMRNQIMALMPDTVVLCSEVMSHFGIAAPQLIDRLRTVAGEAETQLYCTLRRPDEHLVSWHGQQLRFGQSPALLSDPDKGVTLKALHFDYRGVLEPWIARLPQAKIQITPYAELMAAGGSVQHFIDHAGIAFPKGLLEARTMNVSFPAATFPLLREANRALPRPASLALAHEIATLTEGLEMPSQKDVEFFGPAQRARMMEAFRPIHDWLSQTTGREAFFPDLEAMAECRPLTEAEALHRVLDQITPEHLARLSHPEARGFVAGLRETHRAQP